MSTRGDKARGTDPASLQARLAEIVADLEGLARELRVSASAFPATQKKALVAMRAQRIPWTLTASLRDDLETASERLDELVTLLVASCEQTEASLRELWRPRDEP
jgi:hypothetical protein